MNLRAQSLENISRSSTTQYLIDTLYVQLLYFLLYNCIFVLCSEIESPSSWETNNKMSSSGVQRGSGWRRDADAPTLSAPGVDLLLAPHIHSFLAGRFTVSDCLVNLYFA